MATAWGNRGGEARPDAGRRALLEPIGAYRVEIIAIRRGSEKTKVLVGLHREPCPHCLSGTRTVSTWSTLKGMTERISWCQHCFNAQCTLILGGLSGEERQSFEQVCAAMDESACVRYFDCARHAVDYLQRLPGDR